MYIVATSNDEFIVLGDFNLPDLKWVPSEDESCFVPCKPSSEKEFLFTDNLVESGLFQISGICNNLGRQLDLAFSSDPFNSSVTESPHLLSTLDHYHPPLSFILCLDDSFQIIESEHSSCFNFRKANFNELNNLLNNTNFNLFINLTTPIDIALSFFYTSIFACLIQCVPFTVKKTCVSSPPWYTKELRHSRNIRNKLWKTYLKCQTPLNYFYYQQASSNFSDLCQSLYQAYLNKMQTCLITEPKRFYQFINMKRKSDGLPSTFNFLDTSSSDAKEIVNLFATFFSQSYSNTPNEPDLEYHRFLANSPHTSLSSLTISPHTVHEKLCSLNDNFSPGPDGIPAILLKKCAISLCEPLTNLFQLSLSQSVFPSLWKESFIFPIFKKGCKNQISNYRPIAKLSAIPKLFECIVYDSLYFHCKSIVSPLQHGFLKGRSTTTNLTQFVSMTLLAMEKGFDVDVITTDFSKAFDKISHQIIYVKLQAFGFPPLFIKWVKSYLENRVYRVVFIDVI